jgi:glucose/mannose transport system substrate-binding protein
MTKFAVVAALATALMCGTSAYATDLEVTHWWVSGGEAAAVAEFAKAFDNDGQGDKWVDGAIAGSGTTANPIIISRILGGNPMGATQMNTGRDAEDLIKAGLMLDLTDLATQEKWEDIIRPKQVFAPCHYEGHIYCVPVNIHSWQWLWLNRHVFEDNGMAVPTNWNEYVADFPKLKEKGIIPLALGPAWTVSGAFGVMLNGIGGPELGLAINRDKSVDAVKSDAFKAVLQAYADVRDSFDPATQTGLWNEATNLVIQGKAAGQIMGDWAQGEFAVANQVAGKDYDCLPGLGVHEVADTGGDSFYFPKQDNPDITAAQLRLAKLLVSPAVQVAFNLKKGSAPIRADVDTSTANACMQKALKILDNPKEVIPSGEATLSSDTQQQTQDLLSEFFSDKSMTVDQAQAKYADIIAAAQ